MVGEKILKKDETTVCIGSVGRRCSKGSDTGMGREGGVMNGLCSISSYGLSHGFLVKSL
jgi:hypothetical protein